MLSPILSCHDVAASIRFYTEKLGFTLEWSMTDDAGNPNFSCVKFGSTEFLLGTIDFVAPEDRQKLGIGLQLYIEVAPDYDIDALYTKATTAGANITRPLENRDFGVRAFNVKDDDGYHMMFAKPLKSNANA